MMILKFWLYTTTVLSVQKILFFLQTDQKCNNLYFCHYFISNIYNQPKEKSWSSI